MSLTKDNVAKIARLARIAVGPEEQDALVGRLNSILAFVAQLEAVDTTGVEPMRSPTPMSLPLRADVVTDGGIAAQVTANAPEAIHNFFVVPKVME